MEKTNLEDMEIEEMMEKTDNVINYLIEHNLVSKEKPAKDINKETDCPFCKETLKYWQSSYNGHKGFSCGCVDNGIMQE